MKKHASIFITAQSGMGKSYLATLLIDRIHTKRKYVIDYTAEYIIPSFVIFNISVDNYKLIPDIMSKYDRIIFRFELTSNENIERLVDYISWCTFYYRNALIVYEECHEYIDKLKPAKYVRMVATGGRKYGVSSLFITQRPSLLNTTLRSQTNFKIAGKMTDTRDYDAVRPLFTNYHLIPRLKPRVFLFHSYDGREFLFTTEKEKAVHSG